MTDASLTAPSPFALPAGLSPVRLDDGDRLLCQVCGWTRSLPRDGRVTDNEGHAFAHLRADVFTLRFGEGRLPLWGFATGHFSALTKQVLAGHTGR